MSIPSSASGAVKRPVSIIIISLAVVFEALLLLATAAWFVAGLLTQTPLSLGGTIFQLVLILLFAVWLLAVGHFMFRGYRWTRAAAIVWQVFMIVVAVPTLNAGQVLLGLVLLVPALVVAVLIFGRPVTEFLVKGSGPQAL
ncbi:hypothetical protein LVY72_12495 [Arthrobacter sp. I2-34]|uniref:Integral membrane protein n=1 Tax=Arthrobacter hankyongi TaxID=2904801 RepID=A0ABS9L7R7_9MICC|nr:hypothetical protein [Arthrobacter hankyongi]MCG2622721.1 hypothetical protein [Arthrobacter hankyongi]